MAASAVWPFRIPLLVLATILAAFAVPSHPVLPHCSQNSVMEGQLEASSDEGLPTNVTGSIQFHMALHETACIRLEANRSNVLHAIDFLRLEHHYSIAGKYKFALPAVGMSCKCDCAGGDTICSVNDFQYRTCSSTAPLCYRSYKPAQSNTGCFASGPSELCCETTIRPFRDWTFQAVRLKQPSTILVLRYRIFDRLARGWRKSVDSVIEVPLNGGVAKFDLNPEHGVELIAGGSKPNRQLEAGTYFWRVTDSEHPILRSGVGVNDVDEASLEKLGWFRWENNAWNVRNGLVKLTQAQHVHVQDCKAQRYNATLNAEQLVLEGDDPASPVANFNLGQPVDTDPWVGAVEVGARSVRIEHAEGMNLLLTLKARARPHAVHHISHFGAFNGSIQLDKESNRFLNLTFLDARGTLIGQVYASDARTHMDLVFSVQTSETESAEFRAFVALPASIDAQRYVCIHASGDLDSQQCQWLAYSAKPLAEYRVAHRWQTSQSACAGCNERGVDMFIASLDPRQWLNGFNSPMELLVFAVEACICVALLLAAIYVCTKCVIPFARCIVCIPGLPRK